MMLILMPNLAWFMCQWLGLGPAATVAVVLCSSVAAAKSEYGVAKQKNIFLGQAAEEGKPEHIAEKIVEGRLKKWAKDVCLMDQPFVKDTDKSIGELQIEVGAKIGEKISVRRFVRFEVGEGIEKPEDDFAAEVAAQASI